MKFGKWLKSHKIPEWEQSYLDYDKLKKLIAQLEDTHLMLPQTNGGKGTSLSVPRPTNAAGMPVDRLEHTQESFYAFLEQEMRKIEQFTKKQVEIIRRVLSELHSKLPYLHSMSTEEVDALRAVVAKAGDDFLKLEKFVNLNFTGFHKILKKHDKRLPNPCKAFYVARLHDQSWVRGDYSDVIVAMSKAYSALRGDEEKVAEENAKQNFVRSTRKYWVHTEDISEIKYSVLQHLPVFLQTTMAGESDSQLVNSVYLDNHSMELYHGRLEKSPGAIALRFRWYGTGAPEVVFVERKTHNESWAGEVSVKERFTIRESQVKSLLEGSFDVFAELELLRAKGKSEEDLKEWRDLVMEVIQAIDSKQLIPTMRTQYMRTAFQIPFDATVRVSLDTNLCMINERTKETLSGDRWYRDPNIPIPLKEITRFPHAVLEVKLELLDESKTPLWVQEMLESGKLLEVHKFSKFIHGSSVLMPEDVRSIPYWIDDITLSESIRQSGADDLLAPPSDNQYYHHLLPHDKDGQIKLKPPVIRNIKRITPSETEILDSTTNSAAASILRRQGIDDYEDCNCNNWYDTSECCEWAAPMSADHMTTQKVEPKLFFANERTFLSWLHMAVLLSSSSIGVLAFTQESSQAHLFAVITMPLSLCFVLYAVRTYLWRSHKIHTRDADRWDDPFGASMLATLLILCLLFQLYCKVKEAIISSPSVI